MSEINKSDWDTASNPVLAYADSYRQMARTGTTDIGVWSIITDIERNIAPLMADALSQLAALRGDNNSLSERFEQVSAVRDALREELAKRAGSIGALTGERDDLQQRLADAERRNAELAGLLGTARNYIKDLAKSLGNACEFFEGDEDDDPQADEECAEARRFVDRIDAALNKPEEAKP